MNNMDTTESLNMLFNIEHSHQIPSPASNKEADNTGEKWTLFFEKTISAGLHICIMIGFEIFFFFKYIIYMEKQLFKEKILAYLDKFDVTYVQITTPESRQLIASSILNSPEVAIQMDKLYEMYKQGRQEQARVIYKLCKFSLLLFGGAVCTLCVVGCLSYPYRAKIRWKSIGKENIGMLIGLGSFQYIFFTYVILKYNPITDSEIQYWVVNHLYNVLSETSQDRFVPKMLS